VDPSPAFAFLVRYGWSLGAVLMIANIGIARVRMAAAIADGQLTAVEANRFCVNATVAVIALALAGEAAAFGSGIPMLCQSMLPIGRATSPVYVIAGASAVALLYWIWRRGGDEVLARVLPALNHGRRRYTPRQIRWRSLALTIFVWGVFFVGCLTFLSRPRLPFPGCPGAP